MLFIQCIGDNDKGDGFVYKYLCERECACVCVSVHRCDDTKSGLVKMFCALEIKRK